MFFDDEVPMSRKEFYNKHHQNGQWLWNFLPSKPPFFLFPDSFQLTKIAVVRDPYEIFVSAYNNRILWHKDDAFGGLSIEAIIDKLDAGDFTNRHFLPQTYFLGNDPNYFNAISKMPYLDGMVDYINEYFRTAHNLDKIQTRHGAGAINLDQVSEFRGALRKIYASDFAFIKAIGTNLI